MRASFVTVAGIPTRCLHAGDDRAPPLLLIHGHDLIADIWTRNVDTLGRTFRVIAPDLLGSGFSGPPAFDDTPVIAQRVEHLANLVDELKLDRFAICGSSYGALIASLLYLKVPARVTQLVLLGSASAFNTDEQLVRGLKATYEAGRGNMGKRTIDTWHQRIVHAVFVPTCIPESLPSMLLTAYAQPWLYGAWERSITSFITTASLPAYRILHRLEAIAVPTLIVWGRDDPGALLENAEKGVRRMPRAKLDIYDRCRHMPMFEHADRFNDSVTKFLTN